MRRLVLALLLAGIAALPILASRGAHPGFAQTSGPQSDEFNADGFTAPFVVRCGKFAVSPCPDQQGPNTYSLNQTVPGYLRIVTQFGSLVGASNNARNFVVQPVNQSADYTITTKMTFPSGAASVNPLGQTAGLLVYQDDDNFIYLGRVLNGVNSLPQPQLEFLQETNGTPVMSDFTEPNFSSTIYLRITKVGSQYQGSFSLDNVNFTNVAPYQTPNATATTIPTATTVINTPTVVLTPPTSSPTATATALPTTSYTANFIAPQVGVFAWGGTNTAVVTSPLAADFDWFRVGLNSLTPGPSATPTSTATSTATATATATGTPQPTNTPTITPIPTATTTPQPSATAVPTNTLVPTATLQATATVAPTNSPVPTPTPRPTHHATRHTSFSYVSVWYHIIRIGTVQHLQVQAKGHNEHGIWVHVIFGSGAHLDYYENTDSNGFWQKDFTVPGNSISRYSRQAVVTFQLWKGNATAKNFDDFYVVH